MVSFFFAMSWFWLTSWSKNKATAWPIMDKIPNITSRYLIHDNPPLAPGLVNCARRRPKYQVQTTTSYQQGINEGRVVGSGGTMLMRVVRSGHQLNFFSFGICSNKFMTPSQGRRLFCFVHSSNSLDLVSDPSRAFEPIQRPSRAPNLASYVASCTW